MRPEDADEMANSVDADQIALSGALFAHTSVRNLRIITVRILKGDNPTYL